MTSVETREIWNFEGVWMHSVKKAASSKSFRSLNKRSRCKGRQSFNVFLHFASNNDSIYCSRVNGILTNITSFTFVKITFTWLKIFPRLQIWIKDARARLQKIMTKINLSVKSHLNCQTNDYAYHHDMVNIIMLVLTFMPKKRWYAKSDDKKGRCRRVYCLGQRSDSR